MNDLSKTTTLEEAVEWHLKHNVFPPMGAELVPVAIEAIQAGVMYDYWDETAALDEPLALPNGVTYQGMSVVPARDIIDRLALEGFIREELNSIEWCYRCHAEHGGCAVTTDGIEVEENFACPVGKGVDR